MRRQTFAQAIDNRAPKIAGVLRRLEADRIKEPLRVSLFSMKAAAHKAVNGAYSAL
jgi:hypothetical protein